MSRFVEGTPRLAYDTREGREPTLLLVHGNSSHKGLWKPLLQRLPGHRAICLDLRGHGESEWTLPPDYSDAGYADDIRRTIRHLGLRDFILVGHSNGGRASIFYAAHHEPKPRAIVHMDVDPHIPDWQVDYFRQRARAVARPMETMEKALKGMREVDPTVPPETFHPFVEQALRQTPEGLKFAFDPETYGSWRPQDLWPEVQRLPCPLLVLRAQKTVVMSRAAAEKMAQTAPQGRYREIEGAGHFLVLGKPEAVAQAIEEFLREHEL